MLDDVQCRGGQTFQYFTEHLKAIGMLGEMLSLGQTTQNITQHFIQHHVRRNVGLLDHHVELPDIIIFNFGRTLPAFKNVG